MSKFSVLVPAACPACGSTRRTKLNRSKRINCRVIIHEQEYDYVTLSYTTCRDCGQCYIVRQPGRNPVESKAVPDPESGNLSASRTDS